MKHIHKAGGEKKVRNIRKSFSLLLFLLVLSVILIGTTSSNALNDAERKIVVFKKNIDKTQKDEIFKNTGQLS